MDVKGVMDGSAEEKQSPGKSNLWGDGEILEGKRVKKSVERLDIEVPNQKILIIADGSGEKLGEIPRVVLQLTKMKAADLVTLHALLFDRRGKSSLIKRNIRQFSGFPFDADTELYNKKKEKLLHKSNSLAKLKQICDVLDLEKKGTRADLIERILSFLVSPKSSGKRLPKKKKHSKKKLSGKDSKPKKKTKKKAKTSNRKQKTNSSPKKTKSGSKSKAIVMDSSSDEEEREEKERREEEEKERQEEKRETDESEDRSESGDKKEEKEEESEEEEKEASPKPKARAKSKKTAPAKKQKNPAKKRNRADSDSPSSSSGDEPQKKKSKPAAKMKKADSSSNRVEDSSDEDEPLSKIVKKSPTDEQLKETVQSLLKEANLEEMTMKQICRKVFDSYSEHDLSSKKDFIKQTVKALIA